MATRVPRTRDGGTPPATERRGRSPSIGGTTPPQRRSPNTSSRSSPAKSQDSSTAPSTPTKSIPNYLKPTKSIPNYLKPTVSSSPDVSKQQGKKPVLSDSAKLLRRRSFDKPPPPSHSPKTRVSPSPVFRSSSSFSGKTAVSSPRLVPDKNLRAQREAGKQQSMYGASAVKRSSSFLKKKQGTGVLAPTSSKKERGTSPSAKSDASSRTDRESIMSEAEEQMIQDESNDDRSTDTEYPVLPEDQEIITTELKEIEKDDVSVDVKSDDEQPKDDDAANEIVVSVSMEQAYEKEPEEGTLLDGSVEDELKEMEVQQVPEIEMQVSENATVEEQVSKNEEQEQKQEAENTPVEEKKEPENTQVEEKETENVAAVLSQRIVYERKDSGLSNNVIEETASKLREQRKNKVKALAGAFETVISLQDK